MSLVSGEQVNRLVTAVRTTATTLRHRVFLLPDDLTSKEPAVVIQANDHSVRQRKEVAIAEPGVSFSMKALLLARGFTYAELEASRPALSGPREL